MRRDLSPPEVRVLGCLIEKRRTTPDGYPLTRNALRLACNQATNRDPVVDYDEAMVRAATERLARQGLIRFASGHGSRAAKYRHLAGEQLGLGDAELALLALLMLRGPQTPGELRGRSARLHRFAGEDEVEQALERLIEAGLAARVERRPGQKEGRCAHLLSADREDLEDESAGPTAPAAVVQAVPGEEALEQDPALDARVGALEAELRALRADVAELRRRSL